MTKAETLQKIIQERRSVYPSSYSETPIAQHEIEQVLAAANWAPTHKRTEPWRFVVLHNPESRALLGQHMAQYYQENTPPEAFSEAKYQKSLKNTAAAGCIIAIILHRDPQERLPEWEEMCAVACAVQNMWLTCTSLELGAYWSSHGSIKTVGPLLQLADNERCMGYLFMGHTDMALPAGTRTDVESKVRYL
jgi:nitroreductase